MPFTIVLQDITQLSVDAIVNAANDELKMGKGVCGAIFKAAGAQQLQAACDPLAPIKTGEAVITPGFNLAAKFVIHTAGPIYRKWSKEQNERYLRDSYTNSLRLAIKNNCESIAFPLISSGIYGYPKEDALRIAIAAIRDFLAIHELEVTLVIFEKSSFVLNHAMLKAIEGYLEKRYVVSVKLLEKAAMETAGNPVPNADPNEAFSQLLLNLIGSKGKTEAEVSKHANMGRKLFSEIRSAKGYLPSKRSVLALAVALELSLSETEHFLQRAGYALSPAVKSDVIVEFFIANGKYDIFEINAALFAYDQPLLGN